MTNEVGVAAAGAAGVNEALVRGLNDQLAYGQGLWGQVLSWVSERGVEFLMNVVAAALILLAGMVAIRLVKGAAAAALSRVSKMSKLLSDFLVSVVGKTCWAVLALVVMQRLGINVGPLIAGLGVTGFIVGFAFQETLGSFAAGMMIALNQPFKVGDYVVAGGTEGSVCELNMMATVFITPDNKKVIVPNKVVWGSSITNFSALGKRRVDATVRVGYGVDLAKARAIALETLKRVPGVLADPQPAVSIASLNESCVVINLFPWASCADYWGVYSASREEVKKAFEANGIAIPFPQVDVHMVGPVAAGNAHVL